MCFDVVNEMKDLYKLRNKNNITNKMTNKMENLVSDKIM